TSARTPRPPPPGALPPRPAARARSWMPLDVDGRLLPHALELAADHRPAAEHRVDDLHFVPLDLRDQDAMAHLRVELDRDERRHRDLIAGRRRDHGRPAVAQLMAQSPEDARVARSRAP